MIINELVDPSKMTKEELENHMLAILHEMNEELSRINVEYREENGPTDRK